MQVQVQEQAQVQMQEQVQVFDFEAGPKQEPEGPELLETAETMELEEQIPMPAVGQSSEALPNRLRALRKATALGTEIGVGLRAGQESVMHPVAVETAQTAESAQTAQRVGTVERTVMQSPGKRPSS